VFLVVHELVLISTDSNMHGDKIKIKTALHVSGVAITHLQEHKTTVTTASGNRCTVLLFAAIVEELKPVSVCCGWRTIGDVSP
jgi:hypothetical protein